MRPRLLLRPGELVLRLPAPQVPVDAQAVLLPADAEALVRAAAPIPGSIAVLYDRCITRGFPGSMMPAIYGNAYDITQAPGMVAIRYEMVHETRVIRLDNSPRSGQRSHMGDARGRWEGNTLVVETTNLRTPYRNGSANQKLIERFVPTAPGIIEWSMTVDDPETWVRPWTFAMRLTADPEQALFEYACHEGNYAMRNILSAARAEERAAGQK